MRVRVLWFGLLKELAGRDSEVVELPNGSTVADLLGFLQQGAAKLGGYLPAVAVSVNQEYASREALLHDNDEVALLPPVSGGAGRPDPSGTSKVRLVREPVDTPKVMAAIKQPIEGAVVVFEGIVRNHSRGRETRFLDYQAYEPMALREMEKLAAEASSRFEIEDLALVHRLGRLEIGETSVLIVVAAAHRGPAFDACRWLIDRLKHTVPIWKKEHFADGAVWADGEPWPESQLARNACPNSVLDRDRE